MEHSLKDQQRLAAGTSREKWISLKQLDLLETAVFLHLASLGESGFCFIMGGCISLGSLYRFRVGHQLKSLHL